MPELPDVDVYVQKLKERIRGETLEEIRIASPFLVRSVAPPLADAHGRPVIDVRRLGKRVVIGVRPDYWLVLHLMIAGRLQWRDNKVALRGKQQLAAFDFSSGSLLLTEAGTRKRASLFLVRGEEGLAEHNPGGLEPLECGAAEFFTALERENRTLKRALTNPHTFSGIGNAYSDEILHAAGLSPVNGNTHQFPLPDQLGDDNLGGQNHALPITGMKGPAAGMTKMGTYPVEGQLTG